MFNIDDLILLSHVVFYFGIPLFMNSGYKNLKKRKEKVFVNGYTLINLWISGVWYTKYKWGVLMYIAWGLFLYHFTPEN